MEKYRAVKDASEAGRTKLLLPLSFGVSSSVLLHLLDTQLAALRSKAYSHAGYELHVLVVDPSSTSLPNRARAESFQLAKKAFPEYSFTHVSLHSIFKYDSDIEATLVQYTNGKVATDPSLSDEARLDTFLASFGTATSRSDIDNILLTRLVVGFAKRIGCKAILWGDTDNRLAAKALANVAKGRGSCLNWQVSDGMSPWGLEFNFPLRDLFKAEIVTYADLFPELKEIIIPETPVSDNALTKNLSIDELMLRYVRTQGEKYPGVMANVARTANKLQPPSWNPDSAYCRLCGTVISGADTSNNSNVKQNHFCLACTRTQADIIR